MKKQTICHNHGRGVEAFVRQHAGDVTGVISGWDRVRFQGTLRSLYVEDTMQIYLHRAGVLWKDFKGHVCGITRCIRDAASLAAQAAGRPVLYLRSSLLRKETLVEEIRRRDAINEGLIAVLSCVESCRTWFVRGNRRERKLHLEFGTGKCAHLYFYLVHPLVGLMHLRLQTYFPFLAQVCINGREFLSRQMDAAGLSYAREDNCFTRLDDPARAQALLDSQMNTRWPALLDKLIEDYHPMHKRLRQTIPVDYYWTMSESEHATDVMFRDRKSLERIYPALVRHSMSGLGSEHVLNFLGRKRPGESDLRTDLRRREEGVRVKHWLDENSLKLYDKGPVLRSEVTINKPERFQVYRKAEGKPEGKKAWRVLRRGVGDAKRRAQVSRAASERHLGALAACACEKTLGETLGSVCKARVKAGKRHRALRPFEAVDMEVLREIGRGEYALQGLRQRNVREALEAVQPAGLTRAQKAGRARRLIVLFRAHGLLAKIGRTHRYRVTAKAYALAACVLAAANASTPKLIALAT